MQMIRGRVNLNEMKRKAKKLYSFRGPESWRTPRAKSALFENPLLQAAPRALPTLTFPFFPPPSPSVQKGYLTRALADKRKPDSLFYLPLSPLISLGPPNYWKNR